MDISMSCCQLGWTSLKQGPPPSLVTQHTPRPPDWPNEAEPCFSTSSLEPRATTATSWLASSK